MNTIVKSEKNTVTMGWDSPFIIIGEKINPTGRKKLAAALKEGNYEYVRQLAVKQVEAGADILDVNVGVPGPSEPTAGSVASISDAASCGMDPMIAGVAGPSEPTAGSVASISDAALCGMDPMVAGVAGPSEPTAGSVASISDAALCGMNPMIAGVAGPSEPTVGSVFGSSMFSFGLSNQRASLRFGLGNDLLAFTSGFR